jgi:TonB family protein
MNAAFGTILLVLFGTTVGRVPECIKPGPPTAELARATAVFSGKVVGRDYVVEKTASGRVQRLIIKIRVERVWKGDISPDVTMYTSEVHLPNGVTDSIEEDFRFEDEKDYLIYAFGKSDHLMTSKCTRTRELSKAAEDLRELGNGHAPMVNSYAGDNRASETPLVLSAVAPVYPPTAQTANASGDVIVGVAIDRNGNVTSARIISGRDLLRKTSVEAARRWRFSARDNEYRQAELTFTFRIVPDKTDAIDRTPVFYPPYRIEVRSEHFVKVTNY